MLRRNLHVFAALLLAAGAIAHYRYWYAPKERPGIADPTDLPARLLADPRASFALWLPYPHQNLAAAAEQLGDLATVAAAVARQGGRGNSTRALEIPRFGPFIAPPAREIGATISPTGEVVIAARVYPALALLARLAGKVASNPWLAGGAVHLAARPATVSWDGTLWIARTDGAVLPPAADSVDANPAPELGAFRLGHGAAPLPAGCWHLRRTAEGWLTAELEGSRPWPALPPVNLDRSAAALLVVRGPGRPDWRETFAHPGALAISAHASSSGLPRSATFTPPGQEPWKLPARGISELFGGAPETLEAAGLRIVATEEHSLAAAAALAPTVAAWLGPDHPDLVVGLWLEPKAIRESLGGATHLFADLPFLGHRREAATLDDWRTVLAPFEDFSEFSVVVFEHPYRARITLVPSPRH